MAIDTDLSLVGTLHQPKAEHVDQLVLKNLVQNGQHEAAFLEAFHLGDELFETQFNALDGVGANVGNGQRFSRVPRADLNGFGEWAQHIPARATGPNAESCNDCHVRPFSDGAGPTAGNAVRDPQHSGSPGFFISRNAPHLFGLGALQKLAEEMTEKLHTIREDVVNTAIAQEKKISAALIAKGVSFGEISADKNGVLDTSKVEDVSEDLIVRPYQWKGSVATVRDFNRGASHNELGMQPVEITGDGVDGDFDGVVDEMTVGDQTAMAIYNAAQPRPTTRVELAALGLIAPLTQGELDAINNGEQRFQQAKCNTCHTSQLKVINPVFSEPSQNPNYRDLVFPAGQDPVARGVDPSLAVTFDLTQDLPDNIITDTAGNVIFHLGNFETDNNGRAIIRLFGDLKWHDMGPGLAESIDEAGNGSSVFLTENLWGVGSTAPYLHDGRATTLTEAILEHGGEASNSRGKFLNLPTHAQKDLLAYLNNLVLFKQ